MHRQNVARELAKQREHEEKLEARKEARAARKEMQEEKVQEYEKYRRRKSYSCQLLFSPPPLVEVSFGGLVCCKDLLGGCNVLIYPFFFLLSFRHVKIELKIKYGEALSDEEDEDTVFSSDDEDSKKKKDPKESKFKTKTSLTTVTVIEDMDQDDGTFGMPKNNTAAMAKGAKKNGSKSGEQDGEDEEGEEEEEGGDKKRQKLGSSSATTAKGAKKVYPAKEKKKKFRKCHFFLMCLCVPGLDTHCKNLLRLSLLLPLTRFLVIFFSI